MSLVVHRLSATLTLASALALGLAGCDAPSAQTTEGNGPPDDTTSAVAVEAPAPIDECAQALLVTHGRYLGNLRKATVDPAIGGVCGGGGPDTFVRVEVPVRSDLRVAARGVGFTPRLSLAPDDCLGGREIACSVDAPLELRDLAAGTVLRVSVGADPAVFSDLNEEPAPESGPDPLGFELDLGLTRVLAAGEVCQPASRGRCVAGTLCSAGEADQPAVCTTLPADTCSTAERAAVHLDEDSQGALVIDPALPQTDAHAHRCGGGDLRERVLRLELPDAAPGRALEVSVSRPDVGLAVRAPTCLVADEVACATGEASPARVVITDLIGLRAADVAPYLFVELPAGSEHDPAFTLNFRLVAEPSTWGMGSTP